MNKLLIFLISFAALVAIPSISYAAPGDILYGTSNPSINIRLPIGASSTCLLSNGSAPLWGSNCGSGGGGGSTPALPFGSFQLNNSGAFGGSSNALLDLSGNAYFGGNIGIGTPTTSLMRFSLLQPAYLNYSQSVQLGLDDSPVMASNGDTALESSLNGGSIGKVLLSSFDDILLQAYGVASIDPNAINFFSGKVGIGTTSPIANSSTVGTTTSDCFALNSSPTTCLTSGGAGTNYFSNNSASTTLTTGTTLIASNGVFNNVVATSTGTSSVDFGAGSFGNGKVIVDGSGTYGSAGGIYNRIPSALQMGLVTEGTQVYSMANNEQQVGNRDTTQAGAIFRLDMRPTGGEVGGQQSFVIFGSPTGGSSFNNIFSVNTQTGNTYLNEFSGNTALGTTTTIDKNGARFSVRASSTLATDLALLVQDNTNKRLFSIFNNSNVAIGTSTAAQPLVVNGNIESMNSGSDNNATIIGNTNGGAFIGRGSSATALYIQGDSISNAVSVSAGSAGMDLGYAPTGANGSIGVKRIFLGPAGSTFTGNVGVGTSTPVAWLSVQGSFGSTTPLFDVSTTTSSLFATSSFFRINTNGNVGIGTTTPSTVLVAIGTTTTSNLNISGLSNTILAVDANGNVIATTTPSGGGGTNFFSNSGATTTLTTGTVLTATLGTFGSLQATSTAATSTFAGPAVFGSTTSPTASSSLVVTSNNFVGIGTSSPSNALEVNGNSFVSATSTSLNFGLLAGGIIGYNNKILAQASTTLGSYFFGNSGNLTETGFSNFGFGTNNLSNLTTGGSDEAVGPNAFQFLTSGSSDVAVGSLAGTGIAANYRSVIDNGMTFLGTGATRDGNIVASTTPLSNGTAIGANSFVGCSNCIVLGNVGVSSPFVGIGTTSPIAKIDVVGSIGSTSDLMNLSSTTAANVTSSVFKVTSGGRVGIGTTSPLDTLDVYGSVRLEASSTVITSSISGAIVGLGCDSVTSSVATTISSSTTAFITTPQNYPGDGLNWFTYLSAPGVITTKVCSDVTVTPSASKYVVKIIQ